MTKVFVFGIGGRMGKAVSECAAAGGEFVVTGGFDVAPHPSVPTFTALDDIDCEFDAIIDFSRPELTDAVISLASSRRIPAVIASTGHSDEQNAKFAALSKLVPVLKSGNMSMGVNLLLELVDRAAQAFCGMADVEIVEKHHNQKADAPSGTALMLANEIKKNKPGARLVYGREGQCKRAPEDVTIHAVRGGTIVGEHEVIFAADDEIVTLSHVALSRKIFARGALSAAAFLIGKSPALYSMRDVIKG